MRPVVQAECTLKESAAINQILGRRVSQHNFYFKHQYNKIFFTKKHIFILMELTFSSGTVYPVRNRLNIMRRLGLSDSDTCSSTLTGTPGTTTDTGPRRRRERETNRTTQVPGAVEDLQPAKAGGGASLLFSSLLIFNFVLVAPTEQGGASKILRTRQG